MKRSSVEVIMQQSMGLGGELFPDRAAIECYQMGRLQETIGHAMKNSTFYRDKMAGIAAMDFTDYHSLSLLPFTSEDDLRRHGQDMLCVSQDEVARIITMQSSGTTGAPKRLFFTEDDLERTIDFFHHGMKSLAKPGEKAVILLPGSTPDSTGDLLSRALERMNVSSRVYGLVNDPQQAAEEVFVEPFEVLVGFPVQILALSRTQAAQAGTAGQLKSVLLCSDYIPQTVCDELSARWQCRVFSHYGTVETGLGGGVECEGLCGCHLREADLLFEVIRPKTDVVLAAGEWGEIVCSTLSRRGMPLIRYRTGDYGRLLSGPCVCGSHIARLDKVRGRISQVLQLDNGHAISMDMLDETLLSLPGVLDFQAVLQKEENDRDRLSVQLALIPESKNHVVKHAAVLLKEIAQLENIRVSLEENSTGRINKGKRIIEDQRGKKQL
ncbi:MAG: phenylacetate--CoA ligase family protein [Proteobacteria bacterium]|nr:phenylacetate--CoA ligase family protein [Pseudomonadota bacterium]